MILKEAVGMYECLLLLLLFLLYNHRFMDFHVMDIGHHDIL